VQKLFRGLTKYIVVSWLLLIPSSVLAEGTDALTKAISLEYEGEEGMWFPSDMVSDMLFDIELARVLQTKVDVLEERVRAKEDRIILWKDINKKSEEKQLETMKILDKSIEKYEKMDLAKNKWWKHPALWVSVGVVLTVLVQVGSTQLFKAIDD